jgi:REP-associated tyrosine transposase
MARLLRVDRPGLWYHLTARGNEQRVTFRDARDRRHFLELLGQWVERFRIRLHAYVLMPNHYHLLAETTETNLSQSMQWLNVSYTVWFNRRHQRVGHLFQGRFKSVIVDPQTWALGLSRYIHLNPVRVRALGLDKAAQRRHRQGASKKPSPEVVQQRLKQLGSFGWSSYPAYAGYVKVPAWLCCTTVLAFGGGAPEQRAKQYRRYVKEAVCEGQAERPWEGLVGRAVLGGRDFINELTRRTRGTRAEGFAERKLATRPDFATIIGVVEKLKAASWKTFRDQHNDWGRDLVMYLGRKMGGLTLRELAAAVGSGGSVGAMSVAVRRFGQRLATDRQLHAITEKARSQLSNVQS